jgi:hypothetical protein
MKGRARLRIAALTAAAVLGLQAASPASAEQHEHFGRPGERVMIVASVIAGRSSKPGLIPPSLAAAPAAIRTPAAAMIARCRRA